MDKTAEPTGRPVEALVSYSHRDERYRQQLETHLSLLQRQKLLSVWHDRKIGAGTEWKGQINTHLDSAELILLLVSPDFVASDYCYDVEMKRALERHEAGSARVIPIIVRPVHWHDAPFGKLQALPTDGKPIVRWANRDEAFESVVDGIQRAVRELRASKPAPGADPKVAEVKLPPHGARRSPPLWNQLGGLLRLDADQDPIVEAETPRVWGMELPEKLVDAWTQRRGDGQILNLRVSSWSQYDATIEWRTTATMEVRLSALRAADGVQVGSNASVQSMGLPRHVQAFTFHNLEPATAYRIVADSDDDHQEVTFETHGLEPQP